jgi:MFS transporter, AAHS family, 4-hydroxybenzoate transporter
MDPTCAAGPLGATPDFGDRKMSRFQILTLILCGLAVVVDGFDMQLIGYVAPSIIRSLGVDKTALGPVFSAGLLGLVVGSFLLSMLADRIGRRPTLILTLAGLFVCDTLTGGARSLHELLLLRFVTGIALGSVLPNAMALASEYAPSSRRIAAMMLVSVGFTAGAVLGGFLSAIVLPVWGWRGVFYVGSLAPLTISILMLGFLPESLQFLLSRGRQTAARKWLRRIDPSQPDVMFNALPEPTARARKSSVSELFSQGRATTTLLLWGANILNLVTLYFLSNWFPTLMMSMKATQASAVWGGTLLQIGGTIGVIVMGPAIDRRGFSFALCPAFLIAACGLLGLGIRDYGVTATYALAFAVGFCVVGGQNGLNALAAAIYPPNVRATGIGVSVGVGRLFSVCGPVLASQALRIGLSANAIFLCSALPALMCAVILGMPSMRRIARAPLQVVPEPCETEAARIAQT